MPTIVPSEELNRILALIAPHRDGVGVGAVRRDLGFGLSERALQRRLARLAAEGRIGARGSGKGKRYFPASAVPSVQTDHSTRPEPRTLRRLLGKGGEIQPSIIRTVSASRWMLGRGHSERPLVFLSIAGTDIIPAIVGLAREWNWELWGSWGFPAERTANRPFAGALIMDLPGTPLAQRLLKAGCPAVRFGNRPHPNDDLLPAVLPDLAFSGRLAAEHFASRRFRQVAFAGYDPEATDAEMHAAYAAFRERAEDLSMTCRVFSLYAADQKGEHDREARRTRDLMGWLKALPQPMGVFCYNDFMADWIGFACAQAGLTVPEDVAVLGYGNAEQCEIMPVRLSSVDPGTGHRAEVAMRLLRRMMAGEPGPKAPIMVPPAGVVVRESTDVLASRDPVVARAIRYLWDHLAENLLQVDDVADHAGTPRRTLERAFHDQIGHGINAELQRRRLETCCELLTTTKLSVAEIAPRVGFRSKEYLHKLFRATYGMTLRRYRLAMGR